MGSMSGKRGGGIDAGHKAIWVPIWAAILTIASTAGCAGGESDSVGVVNLSGAGSAGETGQTTETPDGQTSIDPTSAGDESGDDPSATTGMSGPTSGAGTDDTDGGSGLACMFAEDCDDGDPCTEDNCLNSACSSEPITCDDGVECTLDSCDPATGACINTPDDAACSDDDLCTGSETCNPAMGCMPGQPVTCGDAQACTADLCDPDTGTCSYEEIVACTPGDGCCPLGCSVADTDCSCTNLGTAATATSSGGGSNSTGYGPANWVDGNDESSCNAACNQCFGWVDNDPTPTGAWMRLDWPSEQIIGSMFIDGIAAGGCQSTSRGLAGGTVQYWSGAAWVDAQSFSGASGDLEFTFDPPLQTSRIRIYNAVAPPGGTNSLAFEWYVYEPLGCTP